MGPAVTTANKRSFKSIRMPEARVEGTDCQPWPIGLRLLAEQGPECPAANEFDTRTGQP
jgi:hypothetical protein